MNRPIAVNAVRLANEVYSGEIHDGLRAVVRRYGRGPVDDPRWLLESAYAYAQVPRFCLSVHRRDMAGNTAQDRVLACAEALLSPACEWILDSERLAEIDLLQDAAMVDAAILLEQWLPDREWTWAVSSPDFGSPLDFSREGQGPVESWTPCPVPRAVLDHAFARVPHVAHLVREKGNRRLNVRFGLPSCEDVTPHRETPLTVLRTMSAAPATARRGAA